MLHEPHDICMFDHWYLSDRDLPEFPSKHYYLEYANEENRDNNKGESLGWHSLLDQTIFGDEAIGLGHWVNNIKHHRRYGWGCINSKKKAKEKTDLSEENTFY
jgi:hypothetical protein